MYNGLVHAHSGLRWLVVLFLLIAIVNAFVKWQGKKPFTGTDKTINLLALIFTHLQLVIGLILYFISSKVDWSADNIMKNDLLRYFMVEHITIMLIGIVLITIGYTKAKRAIEDHKKFKRTFWYYLIGFGLILGGIPWPGGRVPGTGWF